MSQIVNNLIFNKCLVVYFQGCNRLSRKYKNLKLVGFLMKKFLKNYFLGSAANDSDDEEEDGFAGIKKLMESIDTEKVGQFIQNFASPAKLLSWLPLKFQGNFKVL
ncbi:hypothetical protein ACQ4LE_006070 [Meloidogyne hapla]